MIISILSTKCVFGRNNEEVLIAKRIKHFSLWQHYKILVWSLCETVSHCLTNCPIYQSMRDRYINDLPLCTYSRKSPFRKWSPYTRCKFKRFLKSPGIHCRIKAFGPLTSISTPRDDVYVNDNFAVFFLIVTILNINVKNVSTVLKEI